jgi:hypothetical protein
VPTDQLCRFLPARVEHHDRFGRQLVENLLAPIGDETDVQLSLTGIASSQVVGAGRTPDKDDSHRREAATKQAIELSAEEWVGGLGQARIAGDDAGEEYQSRRARSYAGLANSAA